eukprot:1329131-Pyramimonas_sp.AAC.1
MYVDGVVGAVDWGRVPRGRWAHLHLAAKAGLPLGNDLVLMAQKPKTETLRAQVGAFGTSDRSGGRSGSADRTATEPVLLPFLSYTSNTQLDDPRRRLSPHAEPFVPCLVSIFGQGGALPSRRAGGDLPLALANWRGGASGGRRLQQGLRGARRPAGV